MKQSNLKPLWVGYIMVLSIVMTVAVACKKNYTPKPRSYFRIDLPQKAYRMYQSDCNYRFEVPVYSEVVPYQSNNEPCWININFPGYKGTVHITYKALNKDLNLHTEDIHTLAYKHSIKADDIIERPFSFPERKVYGTIYDIKGNTASSLSFYATDSTNHFLSGALYFRVVPNKDSLAPVIRFFSSDVMHLIETLQWE